MRTQKRLSSPVSRHPHLVTRTSSPVTVTVFPGIGAAILSHSLRAVLALPDIHKRLTDSGGEVRSGSPEQLGRHIGDEIAKWRRVVAEKKIEIQ